VARDTRKTAMAATMSWSTRASHCCIMMRRYAGRCDVLRRLLLRRRFG
jgi:hypothetical protein